LKKIVIIGCFLFFLAFSFIANVDSFLVYESQTLPENPDAIIVLGGGRGNRLRAAVNYFNQTNPEYMIVTAGPILDTSMAMLMKKYAVSLGVSSRKIILEEDSLSTKDHPIYLDPILKKYKLNNIVIVTSKFHTNRSYFTFNDYFKDDNNIKIYMIAANDNIDYSRWLFDHESAEKIGIEILKTVVYKFILLFD
jgi:uncharacterized SAM-binding protein YcdF (DUF218 family)